MGAFALRFVLPGVSAVFFLPLPAQQLQPVQNILLHLRLGVTGLEILPEIVPVETNLFPLVRFRLPHDFLDGGQRQAALLGQSPKTDRLIVGGSQGTVLCVA